MVCCTRFCRIVDSSLPLRFGSSSSSSPSSSSLCVDFAAATADDVCCCYINFKLQTHIFTWHPLAVTLTLFLFLTPCAFVWSSLPQDLNGPYLHTQLAESSIIERKKTNEHHHHRTKRVDWCYPNVYTTHRHRTQIIIIELTSTCHSHHTTLAIIRTKKQ